MSIDIRSKVIALRKAGRGPRSIARELGITPGRVAGYLYRAGIVVTPANANHVHSDRLRAAAVAAAEFQNIEDVADAFGVSSRSIYEWRKRVA